MFGHDGRAFDLAADGEPALIEVGRRIEGGATAARLFRWRPGGVTASVSAGGDRVGLASGDGLRASDIVLGRSDLTALAAIAAEWDRARDGWWAFVAGFAAGYGGSPPPPRIWQSLAPGARDPVEVAGPWSEGEARLPVHPVPLGPGVAKVAEIVVRDQRAGAPKGRGTRVGPPRAVVGAAYEAPGGLVVVARRLGLDVRRGSERVVLGAGDAGLPGALLAVLDRR